MKNLIKVKDHPHLYRDEDTGAIVNCDDIAYDRYKNRVKRKNSEKEELNNISLYKFKALLGGLFFCLIFK